MMDIQRDQRPRERLLALGEEALSDQELLALVLGTSGEKGRDVLALARELAGAFQGLAGLEAVAVEQMMKMRGVGMAKACRVKAAFELGRRTSAGRPRAGQPIRDPASVAKWFRVKIGRLPKEVFWSLGLDSKNRVLRPLRVAEGHLSGVEVHPREVFRPLVALGAAATILVHNHPSGDPEPSQEDFALTARLVEVGRLVGIHVLDHVIVGDQGHVSLAERGRLGR